MVSAAIDFGTTNSVIAYVKDNKIKMVPLNGSLLESKSVLFYDFEERSFSVGQEAINALQAGEIGRFFVALKSFLGTKEEIETTLQGKTYTISQLIAIILKSFKRVLENEAKESINRVVLGRPVNFNDNSKELDKLAQLRLESAAKLAGFKEVIFEYEPIAAALTYTKDIKKKQKILIADIGGGTTDYTVVEINGNKKNILSTSGVYIGGNSFDKKIIQNYVSYYLGKDSKYVNMGKTLSVDSRFYADLSEYHKFQTMYDVEIINSIKKLHSMSKEKDKIQRLIELIEQRLYFDFIEAISGAKIELSKIDLATIDMSFFTNPFSLNLSKEQFNNSINFELKEIEKAMQEALKRANSSYSDIDRVFLTGGSTLTPAVRAIYYRYFDESKIEYSNAFSSVGYGLALKAKEIF